MLTLKSNQNTSVYIDAGNARWVSVDDIAARLSQAGISIADGFSLNVSNYLTTTESVNYGKQISSSLNLSRGTHFIIDTSRNGRGPAPDFAWCNPPGRGLGAAPTSVTANPLCDAYLWIKRPGESDGVCNGGPPAGTWWPESALELAQRSTQ